MSLLLKQVGGKDKLLLSAQVNGIGAEINDRSWDLQGSVSVKEVLVLDHITKGKFGYEDTVRAYHLITITFIIC